MRAHHPCRRRRFAGHSAGLKDLAPTYAVRGNIDREPWAQTLPEEAWVQAGGARLYVLHQLSDLDSAVIDDRCAAVIYGHSHKPTAEYRGQCSRFCRSESVGGRV